MWQPTPGLCLTKIPSPLARRGCTLISVPNMHATPPHLNLVVLRSSEIDRGAAFYREIVPMAAFIPYSTAAINSPMKMPNNRTATNPAMTRELQSRTLKRGVVDPSRSP